MNESTMESFSVTNNSTIEQNVDTEEQKVSSLSEQFRATSELIKAYKKQAKKIEKLATSEQMISLVRTRKELLEQIKEEKECREKLLKEDDEYCDIQNKINEALDDLNCIKNDLYVIMSKAQKISGKESVHTDSGVFSESNISVYVDGKKI